MKYTLLCLLSLVSFTAMSRTGSMSGMVRGTAGKPIPEVNILVLRAADSSFVKAAVTNQEGSYQADPLADGQYLVKAQMNGYETKFAGPLTVQGNGAAMPDIILPAKKELREVTVRSQKPLIEAHADKIVMNVENSIISTGSTALEVLQRAPGVNVDQNDNISLKGKQGVSILIDGKQVPVQGADLANILKGMPSGTIDKIEIISNPGARYDASGTAGVINIKTKKDKRKGANGSVSIGYGQGIYPKANGGINLNYRNKKINVYANYNNSYREGLNELILHKQFDSSGLFTSALRQHNYAVIHYNNQVGTLGMDYALNASTNIGLSLTGGSNSYNLTGDNHADVLDAGQQMKSYFDTRSVQDNSWKNYGVSLNMRHTLDTVGTEISVDADYARYHTRTTQDLYTNFKYADGTVQSPDANLYGELYGYTDIKSIKADYVHPLKNNARLEAGLKTSFITADNDPAFYNRSGGVNVYDSTKSNHFIYKENINAAYINANKDWTKWSAQFGLRAEQTIATGHQLVNDDRFERNYIQLFPSIAITRHINPVNDLGITLSRRIDRPTYQQLNPFKNYIDLTSIHQGNPYLSPSFTYTAELSHTYKNQFITQFTYSMTTDVMTQVIVPDQQGVVLVTDRNLAVNTVYMLSGTYPVQVTKWWNSTNYLAGYYSHFEGDIANTPLSNGTLAATLSTQNSFTLPHDWSAEVSGWYQSPQRYGYMLLRAMSGLGAGVQKNLWQKKGTLKLSVTDIFRKQNPVGDNKFNGYQESFIVQRDTRTANISFSYRFGKRTIAPARRRQRGAEEELKRVGGSGGA